MWPVGGVPGGRHGPIFLKGGTVNFRRITTSILFVGIVRCAVEYGNNDYSYVDSMAYHVIALPSVSVDPMVASIFIGQTLTIKCRLTSESYNTSFVYWLKDGRNLTENDGLSHCHNWKRKKNGLRVNRCYSISKFSLKH